MRKMSLIVLMLATAPLVATAQKKEEIKGSGNITTRDVKVSSFSELEVNGVYSVKLSQGNKEEVKVEADDNLQELVEVTNEGSRLVVKMKKDKTFKTKKGLTVHITFKKLNSMKLNTVGNVSSANDLQFSNIHIDNGSVGSLNLTLKANEAEITNSGVGNLQLKGSAESAVIRNSGVGSIEAGEFEVQEMEISNHGVGSAEVNAVREIKSSDSITGKVKNRGKAKIMKTTRI